MRRLAWLCTLLLPLAAQDRGALSKYFDRPEFQWQCKDLTHFELCFLPATPEISIDATAEAAERALSRMLRVARVAAYSPRIHLFLLPSTRALQSLTGAFAAGASVPPEHVVFTVAGNPVAMVHELNHEVFTNLWGESEPWIAEGFAAYLSEPDANGQCRKLIAAGKDQPLGDMINSWWNASLYPATVIYPELGSFVDYLVRRYGIARIQDVWRGGAASLPRVYGKSLDRLERDWRKSLAPPPNPPAQKPYK